MSKMIALTLYINRLILQYLNCSFLKETVELQRNTQRDLIVNYCPQIGRNSSIHLPYHIFFLENETKFT